MAALRQRPLPLLVTWRGKILAKLISQMQTKVFLTNQQEDGPKNPKTNPIFKKITLSTECVKWKIRHGTRDENFRK